MSQGRRGIRVNHSRGLRKFYLIPVEEVGKKERVIRGIKNTTKEVLVESLETYEVWFPSPFILETVWFLNTIFVGFIIYIVYTN